MSDSPGKIRTSIYAIIFLNLICIFVVFIFPRTKFIVSHIHLAYTQLMETSGAPDMPSVVGQSFAIANFLKETTPENSTVFLPPLEEGGHHSPTILRLYPRRLFWGNTPEFKESLRTATSPSYFLSLPDWHPDYCANKTWVKVYNNAVLCIVEQN